MLMSDIRIDCSHDVMVDVESLTGHPRNNNLHPIEQLERFAKVLMIKGVWRYPLVVSKLSGFIISGHGRLEVAKILGMPKVPVNYQDFLNEADEVAQLTFDNEIARWATLDRHAVHLALEEVPDLDIDVLGIEDWINFGVAAEIEDINSLVGVSESFVYKVKCDSSDELERVASLFKTKKTECNYGTLMDIICANTNIRE